MTHVYGANCVSHRTEGFRAGKVCFENGHRAGRPVLVRNEQTVLEEIHIREIHESRDISICTTERIVRDCLNLKKIVERWIPYILTDQPKD